MVQPTGGFETRPYKTRPAEMSLVERVEGFATKVEWRRAYDEINEFERMWTTTASGS